MAQTQTIQPIYRTSPKTFIVTKQVRSYQRYANNLLLMNYETAGTLKVSKRLHLKIGGKDTGLPCWTLTFTSSADADRFVANMSRAGQIDETLRNNPMAWIGGM